MKTSTMTEPTRKKAKLIYQIMSTLRVLDADMNMNQVVCLCWIALNEGRTQVELRQELGMASSTSSRSLAALSKMHRLGKPGLDLIEWVENPDDRRAKLLFLTTRGRHLMGELVDAIR
ncbi:winged helix-turn-helix transcriptional regulator [Aliiroseovarius sp. Z3]|uniref:MarR family winged helix-turn-helix transcriptional regulator n=1 Tax=Aliiroseovarius sp. Z3 TaxID=2811402 RepID=UPI0023B2903C|nr:MarR family winged helix-turn-helix transcriptional regulator [Aliiroseovarius sp. Z3]MDE9449273.1 winged helix-turn-helix transcriptional regulator [Aliiroseovarius sp. Z3]